MKSKDEFISELKKELKSGCNVLIDQSDDWSDGIKLYKDKIMYVKVTRERGQEYKQELTLDQVQSYLEDIAEQRMSKHIKQNAVKNFLDS